VVGLKNDIKERQVTEKEGKEYADQHGLHFVETSASSGTNVKEAFEAAAKLVLDAVESGDLAVDGSEDS